LVAGLDDDDEKGVLRATSAARKKWRSSMNGPFSLRIKNGVAAMAEFRGFSRPIFEGFFEWPHFGPWLPQMGTGTPSVASRLPFISRAKKLSNLSGIQVPGLISAKQITLGR
jgi:hypothetical protein